MKLSFKTKALQKLALLAFVILSTLFSIFTVVRIMLNFQLQDFSVYYRGTQDYLSQRNPYPANPKDGAVIYPPISVVILAPFGLLPYELAENAWTAASYLSLVTTIIILLKSIGPKISVLNFFVLHSLLMLSFPVKFTLGMGQINLLLLLLVALSFYFFQKERQYLSGSMLALAASIKLSPVILLLFYVRKKQWKTVVSFLALFILLNGVGLILLGTQATQDYWMDILPSIPTVGNASYYNQALTGWLSRAFIPDFTAKIVNYIVFGGLLFFSFCNTATHRRSATLELGEYGLFLLSTLIGIGLAWQHHFVTALIPFIALGLLLFEKQRKRKTLLVGLMLVAYLLIALNIKNPSSISGFGHTLLLSHALYGAFLLYGLLMFCLADRKGKKICN